MESIVLGSGRDCHAQNLGLGWCFNLASSAHHVTAMPCVQSPCSPHPADSNLVMPPTRTKQSYNTSEEHEQRVQAAKFGWLQGQHSSICAATHAHNVSLSPSYLVSLHLLNALLGGSPDTE